MATESFKGLEEGIEAWNRRDIEASLKSVREDVVWNTGGQMPDIDPVYEGHEGVRRFFGDFMEPWGEISIKLEDVIEDREDQIVVLVNFHARGRAGIELDGRFFQIYRYDEEHRVREFHAFAEEAKEEAFREAGIDG